MSVEGKVVLITGAGSGIGDGVFNAFGVAECAFGGPGTGTLYTCGADGTVKCHFL